MQLFTPMNVRKKLLITRLRKKCKKNQINKKIEREKKIKWKYFVPNQVCTNLSRANNDQQYFLYSIRHYLYDVREKKNERICNDELEAGE